MDNWNQILDKKISVNQECVRLRKEKRRILFYIVDPFDNSMKRFGFLTPTTAIFLTFLDGKSTLSEVAEKIAYVFSLSLDAAASYIEKEYSYLTSTFGNEIFSDVVQSGIGVNQPHTPLNFVIKREDIDLSHSFRLDAPLDINYIVTQRCNRKCIYCFAERELAPRFKLMALDRVKSVVDEAGRIGVNTLTLSGGEVFLRKDILEIIDVALRANVQPCISTKSFLSSSTCSRLKGIGLSRIQVSIDSFKKDLANFMTGSTTYFDQIQQTVQNLSVAGIQMKWKSVVTSYNIADVTKLLNYAYRNRVAFVHLSLYGRSAFRHQDSIFADREAIDRARDEVEEFKQKCPDMRVEHNFNSVLSSNGGTSSTDLRDVQERGSFMTRSVCAVGRMGLTVLPDGRALACEQLPTKNEFVVGDLKEQSIMDVWNSQQLAQTVMPPKERFKGQPCSSCSMFVQCHTGKGRCIRDAYNMFGNVYAPDPRCPKAPPTPRQL